MGLIYESDIKKLIAYSTMNHVSLILYLISLTLYKVAFFHLNIHAIFKSMLFIGFGVVMLMSYHNQVDSLITLQYNSPIFKVFYYFSCLRLRGLPFLIGFFSKDFIIESILKSDLSFFESVFLLIVLGLSVYYSLKLLKIEFSIEVSYYSLSFYSINLLLSIVLMFLMVNFYTSIFVSLTYEVFYFKFLVYLLIVLFLVILLVNVLKIV